MHAYRLIRPLLFRMEAERAHRLTIRLLAATPPLSPPPPDPQLAVRVAGLDFPNPLGLAAGFDKDAEVPAQMLGLGFGAVEVGTVTPRPQAGNPRPRLFRLVEDRGVVNRLGFNNGGQDAARARLATRRGGGIVGVNIGANKDTPDRIGDYEIGVAAMASVADYLTINISSPNTPGLRALQDPAALAGLLDRALAARPAGGPPVFLKVAPDLETADIDAIARIAIERGLGALIVANTTLSRPPLRSAQAGEQGGLSGAPLAALALQRLRDFRAATGGAIPLVSVGGIGDAADVLGRIAAGASLVQLYSAMVYEGPLLARRILRDLPRLMRREGFSSIEQAIGARA